MAESRGESKRNWHGRNGFLGGISRLAVFVWLFVFLMTPQTARSAVSSGYSEYFIPGSAEQLWALFEDLDNVPDLLEEQGLHTVVAVTAFSDGTTIYYDHWEDPEGYDFDPADPTTADEVWYSNEGDVQQFESSNVPVDPRGSDEYYDGRDRIFVAGGPVVVTYAVWPESIGTVFALSWEIYPIKPFMTHYTIPVGEDLAQAPTSYDDFDRVYVIVQSVQDGNTVEIDDPTTVGVVDLPATLLDQGQVTQLYGVNTGTIVSSTYPVQVQFIVGQAHSYNRSEIRGYSTVPDSLWDTTYYSPVGGFTQGNTDLYIHNPTEAPITIEYEDQDGSGTFDVPAHATISYSDGAGRYVPVTSGVYLGSDSEFWAIGSGDSENYNYDWGYSLVPAYALMDEYFLGWAPGSSEADPIVNGSPVFVTPVGDDTTVYVDYSPTDGAVDEMLTLGRLETARIFDPDNDNTGMHIWATGPLAAAWGEDPDTAETGNPFLDLGYTILPPLEGWMDLVLSLEKTVDPTAVSQGPGNVVTVTLAIPAYDFIVSDVVVTDTLADGWSYVLDSTVVTMPNGDTISDASVEPTINGQVLVWDTFGSLTDLGPNGVLSIVFQMETTETTPTGYNVNQAETSGTVGDDTFTAADEASVYVTPLTIDKDTITPEVRAGEVATYTVVIESSEIVTNVVITDVLPAGFTYLDGSVVAQNAERTSTLDPSVGDTTLTWGTWDIEAGGRLLITFSTNVDAEPGTYDNTASLTSPKTGLVDDAGTTGQDGGTPSGRDPEMDEDVTILGPTAIELLYWRAVPQTGSVLLEWGTASEIDTFGFSIRRSMDTDRRRAVEISFVAANGRGSGAEYSYLDQGVDVGDYYYWLVDIDTSGNVVAWYGPVKAELGLDVSLDHHIYLPLVVR